MEEAAVVEWLHTFDVGSTCGSMAELWDGILIAQILEEISPGHFSKDIVNTSIEGKWVLAAKNIRNILKSLEDYFRDVLERTIDISTIHENDIARSRSEEELFKLIELVVGVAVFCENKQAFISKVFELSPDSQTVLKSMVQRVMESGTETAAQVDDDDDDEAAEAIDDPNAILGDITNANSSNEELNRTRQMLQHLTSERQRLLTDLRSLETANDTLKAQLLQSHAGISPSSSSHAVGAGGVVEESQEQRQAQLRLAKELDDTQRELDFKVVEVEQLRGEIKALSGRLEAARELQAKAEMEARAAGDELDLARSKADRLGKAEQQVDRLTRRLEELAGLKKTNKELTERLDAALDKVSDLEATNKSLAGLQRAADLYKNKAVEAETARDAADSERREVEKVATTLREDLKRAGDKHRAAEDEARALRLRLEDAEQQLAEAQDTLQQAQQSRPATLFAAADTAETDDSHSGETTEQRIKDLQRQLREARAAATHGADEALIETLRKEVEDGRALRRERDEQLSALRKQLAETSTEATRLQREKEDGAADSASVTQLRETQQRLNAATNTVRLLEERLKDREGAVTRLEQEKGKLEAYAKRSLTTFKEKFMAVLQTMREEKRELEARMRAQAERLEKNQETWRREERLLSAALFEVGVKIMDRKIHLSLADGGHGQNVPGSGGSALGLQREALNRAANIEGGTPSGGGGANNVMRSPATPGEPRRLFPGPATPQTPQAGGQK